MRISQLRGVVRAFVASLAIASCPAISHAQPDLVAKQISGPPIVHLQIDVIVTVDVDNIGDPLVGDYVAEVILSDDLVIDGSDPVVGTLTSSSLDPQTIVVQIPSDLPDVLHVWALRVQPAPGETNLANNVALGSTTIVYRSDLSLVDGSPIEVFASVGAAAIEPISVAVENIGTTKSILVFNVVELTPAPWLTIDPPTSFAIGGEPANNIELLIDAAFLQPGSYSTVLRFTNVLTPDDFEDLSVTVTVGDAVFSPGHKLQGQIGYVGDVDTILFDGLEGELLKLSVRSLSGDVAPRLSIVDHGGTVEKVLTFKHSSNYVKKNHKLKSSGPYSIRIEGSASTTGGYMIKTGRKLPKKAFPQSVKVKNPGGSGITDIPVLILRGGSLDFSCSPGAKFTGTIALGFVDSDGAAFDLTSSSTVLADGTTIVQGIEIDTTGEYAVRVSGFGASANESVKVNVNPVQPVRGSGKIHID